MSAQIGQNADTPPAGRRRLADQGRLGRARAWMAKWKDLIVAVLACSASLACLIYAPLLYGFNKDQAKRDAATARAAKVNCQRARTYGPSFAAFLEREHAFPPKVLIAYRTSIPAHCPGDRGQ